VSVTQAPRAQPIVGIAGAFAILVGTVLAVMFVPQDPRPPQALFASGAMLTAALLLPAILRLRHGRVQMALRAENLLMVGLVYWLLLDVLQGAYELEVSQGAAQLAIATTGLAGAAIWFGANFRRVGVPRLVERELTAEWTPEWMFRAAVVCFALGMLAFLIPVGFDVPELFSYFGQSRWSAPWMRGQLGGIEAFWDHLQYFGYALPALYVAYARAKSPFTLKAIVLLAMALLVVALLSQGGGRRIVGVAVGAAILCWVTSAERIRPGAVAVVAVASGALLYLLQQILLFRGVGWFESIDAPETARIHVDDNFLRLAQAIDIVPNEHPYVYFRQIVYVLVRPIPRLFWPGKPTDPGFDLSSVVGGQGASLSMSMIGESYIAFGIAGVVLIALLFGLLCAFVNEMTARRRLDANPVVVPISLMVLFVGLRSLQDLVIMSYAVMGWLAVSAAAHRFRRRPPPTPVHPPPRTRMPR
jgi:oligosaccharide repeat unit polymerase